MAPAPAAPESRRGLNLGNPGAKEYLIVGGAALGLGLLYFWWKGRHKTAGAPAAAGRAAPATPTGLNTSAFSAWIRDHQSTTTTITEDDDDRKRRHKKHRKHREDHDEDDEKREDKDEDDEGKRAA